MEATAKRSRRTRVRSMTVPSQRRNRPFRVLGFLWILSIFVAGSFATSLGSGTARASDLWQNTDLVGANPAIPVPCSGLDSAGLLPAGTQSIGGLVTDTSATPVPVPDMRVYIESPGHGGISLLTNAEGRYVFEGLGDATYFLSFYDETGTYQSSFYDGAGVALTRDDATAVVLSGGGAADIDASLPLETLSTISGRVTDSDGNGVGGAMVSARGRYFGGLVSCALTETDGTYELIDVRAGAYTGEASADGYPTTGPTDPNILVPPDDTTVDFQFPRVYTLSGTVLDGGGIPVETIGVSASRVGGGGSGFGFSGGDGSFELNGLVAGSYIIRYEDGSGLGRYRTGYYGGENVWVETAAEAVPVDVLGGPIVLRVVPAPHVTGTITAPGVGAGVITVSLCDANGEICFSAYADEFGLYSVGVLASGTYTARVSDESGTYLGGYIGAGGTIVLDVNDALPIAVEDTNVGPINATLPSGGRISVHVTVGGLAFESAYVKICQDEFACSDTLNTDSSGDGTSPALWPGTYYVSGTGNEFAYWYDDDGPESLAFGDAYPIQVTAGSSTSITLALPGLGTPTDDGGVGVVAPVVVAPVDGSGGTPVSLTFTDVTGSGTTSLTTSASYDGDPVPSGFQVGLPAFYFDITTTAGYTAPIVVCVTYVESSYTAPENLRLFHFDGSWVDITVPPVDTINHIICGSTDSLSPFVLAERTYQFGGFQGPKAPPKINDVKAGDTIGLQFGLGGDFGLDVFADGTPTMRQIDCATGAAIGSETAATGSLKYASKKGIYTYSWVTLKTWKNTCRQVTLTFRDETVAALWYRLRP